MKKSKWLIIGIIALVVIVIAGFFIGTYNSLNEYTVKIDKASSDIDVQLQRRSDLIPNLVNTVKGYAAHETEVFNAVTENRAKLAGAATNEEKSDADAALSSSLSRLLAIAESYPELKSNQNFIALQDELAGTENRLAKARADYNEITGKYNTAVKKFPTNIAASMFGFSEQAYYEIPESAKEAPTVSF